MIPTRITRHTCQLGGKVIKRANLLRQFVCNECGGALVYTFQWDADTQQTTDIIKCGNCGSRDVVRESTYLRQVSAGWEAMQGLPQELRQLVEEEPTCRSVTEAIEDLYG